MERSNISGMSVDQYRDWIKAKMGDIYLVNESDPIDDIVENMSDKELHVSAVNSEEFRGVSL